MAKRISDKKRARIQRSSKSVRQIAVVEDVSISTAQRWKGKFGKAQKAGRKKGRAGLSPFEDQLFQELLRLTRFKYPDLVRYLEPLRVILKTRTCEKHPSEEGDKAPTWSDRAYYAYLNRQIKAGVGQVSDQKNPPAYTISVHAVRIGWVTENDAIAKGKLLLMVERSSGRLFARTYTSKIETPSVYHCLKMFDRQLRDDDILAIHLVSEDTDPVLQLKPPKSTTLNLKAAKGWTEFHGKPLPLDRLSLVELNSVINWGTEKPGDFLLDPPTPPQTGRMIFPGSFEGRKEADLFLQSLIEAINDNLKTKPLHRGGRVIPLGYS